ncbi:MAG TPA: hypothetical protein VD962_13555 [Rubricoccaceae bacterium]|nr:hypothetical protein [Rubricoccaceae bacterium]
MRAALLLPTVVVVALSAGCAGSSRSPSPDDAFGHRYEGTAPDGRETLIVAPPDTTETYFTYPAVLDSVHVRLAAVEIPPGSAVPVEVLIKGALPDACSVLDAVEQERLGHLITVTLTTRRPRGAMCAQVVRPFRFYLPLDGFLEPGAYTLHVNGAAYPFRIREGEVEAGS